VKVAVGISGTGGGFEKFCKGETDINDASRPIKKIEEDTCFEAGIEFVEFKVGIDGLTFVVNPKNTWAQCLTWSQLKKTWDAGSTIKKWSDIDPAFPNEDIRLYGPGADSGTFDFFTEVVNGELDRSRADYTASEDDNVLVQGVENDQYAMAYFGYAYYRESQDRLRSVKIDKDQDSAGLAVPLSARLGCMEPTDVTINDNSYSLSRPLFVYVKTDALKRPHVQEFLKFYFENSEELVADVGYIPLPPNEYQQQLTKLAASTN
jgi:phosphate transport system substrate-binding protein